PEPADPALGALVLTLAADARGAPLVRLGIVRSLGPAWHSRGGGRIDRRITLDLHLSGAEEGGPVVDAAGALLGMSTAGPRGRALVIPASPRVVGFFAPYRQRYPVSRDVLRGAAEQFQCWVKDQADNWNAPIVEAPKGRRDEFVDLYFNAAKPDPR